MTFKKGQSGNPGGRGQNRPWRDAIERAIKRRGIDGMQALDKLADAFLDKCLEKDVPAIKEFGDRIDGKVPQVLQGDTDKPLFPTSIVINVVDPKDS